MNKRYIKDYFVEDLVAGFKITFPITIMGFVIWQAYLYVPTWVGVIAVQWLGVSLMFTGGSWIIGAFYNASKAHKKYSKPKDETLHPNEEEFHSKEDLII
jgi:hypothetical protein